MYKGIKFFSRNFAGQKGVTHYIQSVEKKKLPTKNTIISKMFFMLFLKMQKR